MNSSKGAGCTEMIMCQQFEFMPELRKY
uniref:Uncharacterized protein n=1 Tax=Anguilla anguilla TaxID=7936 RepID=A0A0E9VYG9_ANGAN